MTCMPSKSAPLSGYNYWLSNHNNEYPYYRTKCYLGFGDMKILSPYTL